MNKTIHIAQFAAGSRYDNIGDTTLFYSEGFSKRANDVSGIFLDNPPMLSSRHASLVWRYYKDVDRYILIHVQGSHVVSSAMGRNYPFRAGYEVSRDDMNAIDFSLTSLFAVMPRIENMPKGRTEAQRDIACGHPYLSRQAEALAGQLINALIRGQRLYLSMPVPDEDYRCDGIFNAPELTVLLTAIESLPLQLRRYATFGFCIDDRFSFVLDDVLLMVYDEDSKINIPSNAIAMSWEKAVTTPPVVDAVSLNALQAVKLPGANSPLLSLDALRQAVDVARKSPADLTAAEWPIWIALGRQFGELQVTGWPQFAAYYQRMDAQTREQWVAYCRKTSIGWPLNGFSEPLLGVMRYGDDEHRQIQRAALPAFLLEGGYSFLFKEGLTSELKENLDANLLSANTKNPRLRASGNGTRYTPTINGSVQRACRHSSKTFSAVMWRLSSRT